MMRVRLLVNWAGESVRVVNGQYCTTHREWLDGYTVIDLDVAHVFESYERDVAEAPMWMAVLQAVKAYNEAPDGRPTHVAADYMTDLWQLWHEEGCPMPAHAAAMPATGAPSDML